MQQQQRFACRWCGVDLGWDASSGVCSTACLRRAQGFAAVAAEWEQPGSLETDSQRAEREVAAAWDQDATALSAE